MIVVVTGNIGCGKSTVAKLLVERLPRAALFDYDAAVKDVYTNEVFRHDLEQLFGTHDKTKISEIVFNDTVAMSRLKKVAQPYMDVQMITFIQKHQRNTMVLDIPLWFEGQMNERFGCDFVVTVVADEATQLKRVKERSGWDEEKTLAVINNQMPQALKVSFADYVITNRWDVDMLAKQVDDFVSTHINGEH